MRKSFTYSRDIIRGFQVNVEISRFLWHFLLIQERKLKKVSQELISTWDPRNLETQKRGQTLELTPGQPYNRHVIFIGGCPGVALESRSTFPLTTQKTGKLKRKKKEKNVFQSFEWWVTHLLFFHIHSLSLGRVDTTLYSFCLLSLVVSTLPSERVSVWKEE